MNPMYCVLAGIGGVVIVGSLSLALGHDGSVLSAVIGAITGLAGYALGKTTSK